MDKLIFIPISLVAGLAAGFIGKKAFEGTWGLIDDSEPPDPKHRQTSLAKLAAALLLEGAIFRLVRGIADHGSRRAFARSTGVWPGKERPEPE